MIFYEVLLFIDFYLQVFMRQKRKMNFKFRLFIAGWKMNKKKKNRKSEAALKSRETDFKGTLLFDEQNTQFFWLLISSVVCGHKKWKSVSVLLQYKRRKNKKKKRRNFCLSFLLFFFAHLAGHSFSVLIFHISSILWTVVLSSFQHPWLSMKDKKSLSFRKFLHFDPLFRNHLIDWKPSSIFQGIIKGCRNLLFCNI